MIASAEILSPERMRGSTRACISAEPRLRIGGAPMVCEKSPAPTPPIYSNGEPYPLDENGFYDSAPDDELPTIIMV